MSLILLQIGSIKIYAYPFLIFAGILLVTELAIYTGKQNKINKRQILDIIAIIFISGFVGSKIMYILQNSNSIFSDLFNFYKFNDAGLILYGGIIFASISAYIYIKLYKLPVLKILDIIFLFLPLGIAIGRYGCFFNGCCYGIISNSSLGVRFPKFYSVKYGLVGSEPFLEHLHKGLVNHSDLYSLPVYPTQMISSFANLIIFILLLIAYKKFKISGLITILFFFIYSIFRFSIEFIRSEPRYYLNLTLSQYISILIFSLSVIVLRKLLKKLKSQIP